MPSRSWRLLANHPDPAPPGRGGRCPTCKERALGVANPHRPFCSLTCRLLDLGVWLDEGYRIAGESFPVTDEPHVR
jgi:uncharacterized protein